MKRAIQIGGLTVIMLLVSVGVARADSLQFVESDQADSATFNLLQNPKLTSFTAGNDFLKDAQMFTESEAAPIFLRRLTFLVLTLALTRSRVMLRRRLCPNLL